MTKADSDPPEIGPNAIWCRFNSQWRSRAVVVDRDTGVIEFRHCHVPRRFLATAQPTFFCSTADVKAVHFTPRFRNSPGGLTVVTTTGKAFISERGTHFAKLRAWFDEAVPTNQPDFSTDNPAIGFVYVAGAIVGLFTGVFLSRNAGNTALVVATVFGAAFGIVGSYLLVYLGGRLLKTDLAYLIRDGMVGAMVGFGISAAIRPLIGWNIAPMAAIVKAGAVLGVMAGVKKRSLKKQMAEPCMNRTSLRRADSPRVLLVSCFRSSTFFPLDRSPVMPAVLSEIGGPYDA